VTNQPIKKFLTWLK